MKKLTVAICSYNRADRLSDLIFALRAQTCPAPFDILIVNNNSSDNTLEVLNRIKDEPGPTLHFVTEKKQGIAHARNRAIEECLDSDYMFVMDDDELPTQGILEALYRSLDKDGIDCVGGKVDVRFPNNKRPSWLNDELLGFLAETNYGDKPFHIKDNTTPIWTANIAYRVDIFRQNPGLRFDIRYNREGNAVGGGEDAMMFNEWIKRGYKLAYNPKMTVEHYVEDWRLKQSYFYRLHFTSGRRKGLYELPNYQNTTFGIPLFLIKQATSQMIESIKMHITNNRHKVRQGMNTAHAFGLIYGTYLRTKKATPARQEN